MHCPVDEDSINFQTSLSLEEVAEFYRQAFVDQGLAKHKATTVVSDEAVNLVFDGAPNGKAVVVQTFTMGDLTNVNVRADKQHPYEDI